MPGRRHHYTKKERRQVMHIAVSERRRGKTPKKALEIGWATVTKQVYSKRRKK